MEMNPFLWFLVTLLTLFLTLFHLNVKRNRNKKLPPKAAGAWPLIGHLPSLAGPEPPHVILSKMADHHGPVFTIRLGMRRALIVSNWEAAKECFTTNDVAFSNRPKSIALQHMTYDFAMFGFTEYGSYWREMRKICSQKLLSHQRVALLGSSKIDDTVGGMMASLYRSCDGSDGGKGQSPQDLKKLFGEVTAGLMVRVVGGERVWERLEKREIEKWRRASDEFFQLMAGFSLPDLIPFLKWFDFFDGISKKVRKTEEKFDGMIHAWLEGVKQGKKMGASEDDGGFMAEIMTSVDRVAREIPGYDADTINKATCRNMMLGGIGTMDTTLTWILSLLLNNRHTLKRAQQELDTHVSRERRVKSSDLENLVYIKAIIKETCRLCPPAPLLAPREAVVDCTVAGHHIPAGTYLIINMWRLHHDPRVWSDPLKFEPERFLTSHKEVDVRGQHYELLPFGGGRRVCAGVSFALQVVELVLASLLHGFDIETDEPVDMNGSLAAVGAPNTKATPLEVFLKPRLSFSVYG